MFQVPLIFWPKHLLTMYFVSFLQFEMHNPPASCCVYLGNWLQN